MIKKKKNHTHQNTPNLRLKPSSVGIIYGCLIKVIKLIIKKNKGYQIGKIIFLQ